MKKPEKRHYWAMAGGAAPIFIGYGIIVVHRLGWNVEETHPIRWIANDYGSMIAALIALGIAIATIRVMREQIADGREVADHRYRIDRVNEIRSKIETLRSSWAEFLLSGQAATKGYLVAQTVQEAATEEELRKKRKDTFEYTVGFRPPIPALPLFDTGFLPPENRAILTRLRTRFNAEAVRLNSSELIYGALQISFNSVLQEWQKIEDSVLGTMIFMELCAECIESNQEPDGEISQLKAQEIVNRLMLTRETPKLLRFHGVPEVPNQDPGFRTALEMIPESEEMTTTT